MKLGQPTDERKTEGINGLAIVLENALSKEIKEFKRFLTSFSATDWIILSDYCIENKKYPHNTMVFTIIPDGKYMLLPHQIRIYLKNDLKDCSKNISKDTIAFLKSNKIFTFIFAFDKKDKFIPTKQMAQQILNESLLMMKNWLNADKNVELIKKTKMMIEDAKSKTFNLRLFNNVVLSAFFAAFIATIIAKNIKLSGVLWINDRDKIHDKWPKVTGYMFHQNLHAFLSCQNIPNVEKVGILDKGCEKEFDEYIRIPDYFAGVAARMEMMKGELHSGLKKDALLLDQVFKDNPRLVIVKIVFGEKEWIKIIKVKSTLEKLETGST